ncbi:hypothetical protein YC2023_028135 [Brassica napus]
MSGLATVAVGHTFDTVKMVTWLTWGNIGVLTGGLGGKAVRIFLLEFHELLS